MKKIIMPIMFAFVAFGVKAQTNVFNTTGNAGAGTTTPATLLEVSSATGSSAIVPTTVTITSTTNATDWNTAAPWGTLDFFSKDLSGTGATVRARVGVFMTDAAGDHDDMAFFTNNGLGLNEGMRLNYIGNLGIGTSNPATIVDAVSSLTSTGLRSLCSASLSPTSGGGLLTATTLIPTAANQRIGYVGFGGVSTGTTYKYAANICGFSSEAWSSATNGSYLTFSTVQNSTVTPNERMRLDNTGTLLIATTTSVPGYKLAVNGSAIAVAMTVQANANWPDYVFDNTYKLPALADLKNYIQENHHLPNIPTAAEIEKNGLNLGDVDKALVKKTEELTLYVINQDEQLKKQSDIIKAQQEQINQLMKAVVILEQSGVKK